MGVLIAGTTSDAGKSLVTAGVCRWLARLGVRHYLARHPGTRRLRGVISVIDGELR